MDAVRILVLHEGVVQEAARLVGHLERRDRHPVALDRAVDQADPLRVADRALVGDEHPGGAEILRVARLEAEVACRAR
jgi:hypothetical protein